MNCLLDCIYIYISISISIYIYIHIYIHIQQDHKTSLETAPYILCSFQDPENFSSTAGEVLKYFPVPENIGEII